MHVKNNVVTSLLKILTTTLHTWMLSYQNHVIVGICKFLNEKW